MLSVLPIGFDSESNKIDAENGIQAGYGKITNAVSSYILAVTQHTHLNGVQGVVPIDIHRDLRLRSDVMSDA